MATIPEALSLAVQYHQSGHLQAAEGLYRQILLVQPANANVLHLLGVLAGQAGRGDEAIEWISRAIQLQPSEPVFHYNLGKAYQEQGQLAQAAAEYEVTVRWKPDYTEAHNNLGLVLQELGRLPEAVAHCQQALRLNPDYAVAHNNLGLAFQAQGRFADAMVCYQESLRLKPGFAQAHLNLGNVCKDQGRWDEALICYQEALRCKPDYAEACLNLGNLYKDQGQMAEAVAQYRQALGLKPDYVGAHSCLVYCLHLHADYDLMAIHEECRHWNQQHAEPLRGLIQVYANHPDPDRRLRIGYISPDFRDHVDSFFMIPLLSNHDHEQYEVFCYADVVCPDILTDRLRRHADVWCSTVGLSDQQVAAKVHDDRIDILVDLKLHTAGNRLLVFARKPAPVQVTWLGYPGTTGLSTMDYRLTDRYLDPPGINDDCYSEESIRLPDTFWCYDPLADQPPVNALPARHNGYITFGCLNTFSKINDNVLTTWAEVLRTLPGSHLVLLAPRGQARNRVLAMLEQEGVAASQVEFVDKQPRPAYLQLYHRMDLVLDPFPCNGHTTSFDALWMGVPIITLVGKAPFGRAGWSQLSNLGLQELAADTHQRYMEMAIQLARDLARLEELRSTLRQRLLASPLMDARRFTRNLEQAYRQMWHRWCGRERSSE